MRREAAARDKGYAVLCYLCAKASVTAPIEAAARHHPTAKGVRVNLGAAPAVRVATSTARPDRLGEVRELSGRLATPLSPEDQIVEVWRRDYNQVRPRSALMDIVAAEFARQARGLRPIEGLMTAEN